MLSDFYKINYFIIKNCVKNAILCFNFMLIFFINYFCVLYNFLKMIENYTKQEFIILYLNKILVACNFLFLNSKIVFEKNL